MKVRNVMVAGLLALGAAGLAYAATDNAGPDDGVQQMHRMHHMRGMARASVEVAAMHNILAEELSARTGKTTEEIKALFEKSNPHDAMQQLGLTHDDMRPLMEQAHATLIDRAAAAGLITADQAKRLHETPLPHPGGRRGPPPEGEGK